MAKRYILFLTLATTIVIGDIALMWWWMQKHPAPLKKPAQVAEKAAKPLEKEPVEKKPPKAAAEVAPKKPAEKLLAQAEADARKEPKQVWVTLGSADAEAPYRMLVTFTNRGAAVERIELNSPRFHDLEDRSGYLGHLEGVKAPDNAGCLVRVVGGGTPADRAGLKAGDIITSLAGEKVTAPKHLGELLSQRLPGDDVELTVLRTGKTETMRATLARRPLEVIRPEPDYLGPEVRDPLSFLLTLNQVGEDKLADADDELPGVRMCTSNWTLLAHDPKKPDEVAFEYVLDKRQLRVLKTYRLAKLSPEEQNDVNAPGFHLNLRIDFENTGKKARQVAYRLDGPTGLPTEGWWYSQNTKIGHGGSPGVRDMVWYGQEKGQEKGRQVTFYQINASVLADGNPPTYSKGVDVVYAGVDAQYVASVLIPRLAGDAPQRFESVVPLRVGPVHDDKKKLVDTSCRLISEVVKVEPGKPLTEEFQIFAGPKRPDLLAAYAQPYGLGDLVYYGWFGWVSAPMLRILHFFYDIVGNYGLAIIMLTVLVRSCMFPLSRKQALNAAKMQELQPELKKLADKYKNPEERMKAQREFFRKHNYHPLSGCLPALVQLPIFLGLYRSLAVDIELRQAPLISESIRWCSNLGAPDM
ncbi:MAG: YidC/Oxa1 family insertase periplasmic-domain containing protein, partial [Pirellulales bacterium]